MAPSKRKDEKLLTEAELELMAILWKRGEGTVNDVIEQLAKGRAQAYTTISTILRILEQKGFLTTRKEGRGHVYIPSVKKDDYESRTVRDVVDRVFEGAPVALARQLLQTSELSGDELAELRQMIEKLEGKQG
ncbi:MAG: BlaI/MecI/CopY family transcriptional regulator [Bdellovibrionota bacterium]